jgi:endoglucanase
MKLQAVIVGISLVALAHVPACSSNGGGGATGGSTTSSGGSGGSASGGATGSGGKASGGVTGSGGSASGGTVASGGKATGGGSGSGGNVTGGTTSNGGAGGSGSGGNSRGSGGVTTSGGSGAGGTGGTTATGGNSGGSTSLPLTVDKPSTDTTWSQGLKTAANGPIPWIVVDQFGYRTTAQKVAVIRSPQTGYDSSAAFTPGSKYSVVSKSTGKSVKDGAPVAWSGGATDTSSGDKVWWFDFSDVTAPGTYTVVDNDKNVRSVEFDIDDNVYRSVLKHAVRMYYYQRADIAKTAACAGADWTDGVCLMGTGQDSQAHAWLAQTDASQVRDLRGGWFDAGDTNRYTAWAAGTVLTLLHAFDENPSAFGDDYSIPESGNGTPDLLDESKVALDWLVRMQNTDGSLLCILGSDAASPISAATKPSYYGPPTTNATLMGAAVFAYASKIYDARPESSLKTFAADLKSRAAKAWSWADANPSVLYYNNDESKQAGSSGLGAGDQETDDAGRLFSKLQAAVYLYDVTGDDTYRSFAESNWNKVLSSSGPSEWDMEKADTVMYLARLSGVTASVASAITSQVTTNVGNELAAVTSSKDPYRAYLKDYTWGSNQIKMAQARLYQHLAARGSGANADQAAAAAEDYVHYLHGVNPLGMVYLTNMQRAGAEHSVTTIFHSWFADKSPKWDTTTASTPGPAPGFLPGGPNNSGFGPDGCCTAPQGDPAYQCYGSSDFALCSQNWEPPMNQPQQKSYLDYNGGWPVGSWPITEPSTGYQAKYVLVLSALAH